MAAANRGPLVVLNANRYRCDAFIIKQDHIGALNLPHLHLEDVPKMAQMMRTDITPVLGWLWNVMAQHALEYLGFDRRPSGNNWPHVWWIPIGILGRIPIHAAGNHFNGSHEMVLDRVVPSYSGSVKALWYVSMPQTLGQSSLHFASDEMNMLRDICPSLNLQNIESAQPTKAQVICHLKGCTVFHFAGHGISDSTEPSASSLILDDWQKNRLTVGDLRDLRLEENSPFLSYLSACSTGGPSGKHLTPIVEIARIFYETLRKEGMTDDAVSRGLHRAIREFRDVDEQIANSRWQEDEKDEPENLDDASNNPTLESSVEDNQPSKFLYLVFTRRGVFMYIDGKHIIRS
ncbi:CHAT domain-containing protein [Aspergillus glaucus CBS 516.65]|uniref:CHAT domain-containing protein n=1 Tax=Aspergillus glaucus CBS 516.65 TaxID=1160497 RepID=A0A1L9VKD9_ASPGL|nr:hypothetical protein ASPGLDRAFT_25814 [Aspergillus glaucus CBS 516.65]OJJ84361.1 hypothetical protein ASPGLDRAFT_25814 [Aspergillus glaucus CBS 516.65]